MSDITKLALSRRHLLKAAGLGTAGLAVGLPALAMAGKVDSGYIEKDHVIFPDLRAPDDRPGLPLPKDPWPRNEKVGFAIVGLGRVAIGQILPAFMHSRKAKLVALVSGSSEKAQLVAGQYGISDKAIYDYKHFDQIADNPDIQVVYIALPNFLHHEFTVHAAKAGKHVLCETPMATNSADAHTMITACHDANVKLMIGYRCQYDPFNTTVKQMLRSGNYGRTRIIDATNGKNIAESNQWRLKSGGGPLFDAGIYCLNTARFITGEEPIEVIGRTYTPADDSRFTHVEEDVTFMLRFPSGITANCAGSFGMHESGYMRIQMEKGWSQLENAFSYSGLQLNVNQKGGNIEVAEKLYIEPKNQFALEMDHMAECVKYNKTPFTPGEEGMQDHLLMEAIYHSAASGQAVNFAPNSKLDISRGTPPETFQ